MNNNNFNSIIGRLQHHAECQPDNSAFVFLDEGGAEEAVSYRQLHSKASNLSQYLRGNNLHNKRVLLLYHSNFEFIVAFMGALYAGAIPVPVHLPRKNQELNRLKGIVVDAKVSAVLSHRSISKAFQGISDKLIAKYKLQWIDTDCVDFHFTEPQFVMDVSLDSLAFLQYTSGSTGSPKGVMVSHKNLMHNEQMISDAFGHDQNTVVVGWLPFYHDMGLIGNILQPLYLGRPCILMSPLSFIQKPIRWLKAISDFKATTSGGPNFAYEMCVRKITSEQKADLDLSNWQLAFNGAEPVRAEVLDQFSECFSSCGFRHEAFYPCYGMAETTLFLTGGEYSAKPTYHSIEKNELKKNDIGSSSVEKKIVVGCGRSWSDQNVVIVDPDSLKRCTDNQVGEIWVGGPSVTMGYWRKPKLTKKIFQAYTRDTHEGPFLRTGDLGYMRDGELFVSGRLKDIIIIRGQNHYPEDIEFTVQKSHRVLRAGCMAAFSITKDIEEKLVLVQEISRRYLNQLDIESLTAQIKEVVSKNFGLQVYKISYVRTGCIPKTSSGKIRRNRCKDLYLSGELASISLVNQNYHMQYSDLAPI